MPGAQAAWRTVAPVGKVPEMVAIGDEEVEAVVVASSPRDLLPGKPRGYCCR
jgi:hypothetical protein